MSTALRLRLAPQNADVNEETLVLLAKRVQLAQRRQDAEATERCGGGLVSRLLSACFPKERAPRPAMQQALSACPALRELSGAAWRAIAESSLLLELEAGEEIPAARAATVLVSGALERVVGGRVSARQAQGQLVGMGGLVHPVSDGASLRAAAHSWVLCVSFARLRSRMERDAELAAELRFMLAEQLQGSLRVQAEAQPLAA